MKEIYCQNCGRELTNEGGDVTSTGRIYCHGYKEDRESRCMDHEMMLMFKGKVRPQPFTTDYLSAKEIQESINRGNLKEYGPLENKTN